VTTDNGSETEDEDKDEAQVEALEEGSSHESPAALSDEDRPAKLVWEVVTSALSPDSHGFVSPGSGCENSYEDEDTAEEEEEEKEEEDDDDDEDKDKDDTLEDVHIKSDRLFSLLEQDMDDEEAGALHHKS
jgi:hypothetical protein